MVIGAKLTLVIRSQAAEHVLMPSSMSVAIVDLLQTVRDSCAPTKRANKAHDILISRLLGNSCAMV